jgi:hypothetical protein
MITLAYSSKGDPASSYSTAGMALRIIWPLKPLDYIKVRLPSVGVYRICTL